MEHTPGPWHFEKVLGSDDGLVYARINGHGKDAQVGFAGVYLKSWDKRRETLKLHEAECLANAHLIAAAPAMLAALEHIYGLAYPGDGDWLASIADAASAAIAQAKGEA